MSVLSFPRRTGSSAPAAPRVQRLGASIIGIAPLDELDMASAPALETALREAQTAASVVVLDLTALTFCDSAGLHLAVEADRRAGETGGTLLIVPGSPAVQLAFAVTGLDRWLDFVDEYGVPADGATG